MWDAHCDLPVIRNLEYAVFIRQKALRSHGLLYPFLIIIGLFDPSVCTLKQTVVSLRIKKALFVKARPLKLMIHVCGDHKIRPITDQRQQLMIYRLRRIDVAVEIDMARPPGPTRFRVRKGIKTARIHIHDSEVVSEIEKIPVEALAAVGEPGGSG